MSKIILEQLKTKILIGVFEWEKRVPQDVFIDLEMEFDTSKAAHSDSIDDTLDYKEVAKRILDFTENNHFSLIETLAEKLANLLIEEFKVQAVKVSVSKPRAVRGSNNVKIIVTKNC